MSKIQLVIEIDEEEYHEIKIDNISYNSALRGLKSIQRGTPLPKGHGKIGDIDAIILELSISKDMTIEGKMNASKILWYAWHNMCLVEADKEASE